MRALILCLLLLILLPFAPSRADGATQTGRTVNITRIDPRTGGAFQLQLSAQGSSDATQGNGAKLTATWKSGGVEFKVELVQGANEEGDVFRRRFDSMVAVELTAHPVDP